MTASRYGRRHHYPTPSGAYLSIVGAGFAGGCGGPAPVVLEFLEKTTVREKSESVGQYERE